MAEGFTSSLNINIRTEEAEQKIKRLKRSIEDIKRAASSLSSLSLGSLGDSLKELEGGTGSLAYEMKRLKSDGLNPLQAVLKNTGAALATLGSAFLTFKGLKAFSNDLLQAATDADRYRASLQAVMKTGEEADSLFDYAKKYAALNPVDLDETLQTIVKFKSVGVKNATEAMEAVANLSAVTQRSMEDGALALVSTNSRALQKFGVLVRRTGDTARVQIGDTIEYVSNDLDHIRQKIVDIANIKYGNSLEKFATTYRGTTKTISGLITNIKYDVMGLSDESGPFGTLTSRLSDVRKELTAWLDDPSYKDFVSQSQTSLNKVVKDMITMGEGIAGVMKIAVENIDKVLAGLKGLAGYKLSKGLLALAGATGPAGMAAAASVGALVYLNDAYPVQEKTGVELAQNDLEQLMKRKSALEKAVQEQEGLYNAYAANQTRLELEDLTSQISAQRIHISELQKLEETLKNSVNKTEKPTFQPDLDKIEDEYSKVVKGEHTYWKARLAARKIGEAEYLSQVEKWANDPKLSEMMQLDFTAEALNLKDSMSQSATTALQKQLRAQESALKEALQNQKEAFRSYWQGLSYEYEQGFSGGDAYFSQLKSGFDKLKEEFAGKGGNVSSVASWTDEMKQLFSMVQGVGSDNLSKVFDSLSQSVDDGTLSTEAAITSLYELKAQYSNFPQLVNAIDEQIEKMRQNTTQNFLDLKKAGISWTQSFQSGISNAIVAGEGFGDMLSSLGQQMASFALQWAMFGQNGKSGMLGGLFSGILGGGKVGSGGGISSTAAKGKVFSPYGIEPFADGGIVSRPTLFRFARGTGLMGEAGPEGVLPLQRDSQGRLGVIVANTSQQTATQAASVVTISTPVTVTVNTGGLGGNMDEKQAQSIGKQINAAVEAKVIESMYKYQRQGYFRNFSRS